MNKTVNLLLLVAGLCLVRLVHASAPPAPRTVTFVCEHGVAKSVIAAAHFNQLAATAGLNYRAVARGLSVEPTLQAATVAGLQKDGIDVTGIAPVGLSPADERSSALVISIGIENEPSYLRTPKLLEWDGVPAVSQNYDVARNDLLQRITALISELKTKTR